MLSAQPLASAQELEIPPEFEMIPRPWVRQYWPAIEEDAQLLVIAYQLSADEREAFLHLHYLAWRDQYFHDQEFIKSVSIEDSDEEAGRKRNEWAELAPMRPQALVWLIESLLPPGDYTEAHSRYSELKGHVVNLRWAAQDRQVAGDEMLRFLTSARDAATSLKDKYTGNPVPRQHAIFEGPTDPVSRQPETHDAPQNPRPIRGGVFARAAEVSVEKAAPAPAPCETDNPSWTMACLIAPIEDTWLQNAKGMMAAANHVGAPEMWKEIEARAAVYRKQHCQAYADLEPITSRAEFKKRLEALDEPLWALLVELEMRLKAPPTN